MSEPVFDASVLIAILQGERVSPDVYDVLEGAVIGAVNFAEVLTKMEDAKAWGLAEVEILVKLFNRIEPFTVAQAHSVASLRSRTKQFGLSLGDRACLALALELGAEVYTADHLWAQVDVGCKIHLVRERRDSIQ
jgi:PIN domain nuclease of toxin-antitoxin system